MSVSHARRATDVENTCDGTHSHTTRHDRTDATYVMLRSRALTCLSVMLRDAMARKRRVRRLPGGAVPVIGVYVRKRRVASNSLAITVN